MKKRTSPWLILFILLMVLIAVCGVALMIYGSATNGPIIRLPGGNKFAWMAGMLYG
ncbi:MAG: hypothetical protein IJ438_08540 [Clostridia bacterium]|nr:hypothetical protein [Clostridia bacterium]